MVNIFNLKRFRESLEEHHLRKDQQEDYDNKFFNDFWLRS